MSQSKSPTFELKGQAFVVPQKLPLLEGLCWNIANPYSLTPQEMLGIYEERWHYKDVLGSPSNEELRYIQAIGRKFQGLPLVSMDKPRKQDIFDGINLVIEQLDLDLFKKQQIVLGGGALIGLKYEQLRYSSDLDFLVSPRNYRVVRPLLKSGKSIFLSEEGFRASVPRIDRYGIRYPLFISSGNKEIALKLEIIADYNLEIENPEVYNNLPCLSSHDRVAAKLMANADRWADSGKYSRDLIDLAIIANASGGLPLEAIEKSKMVYPDAETSLKSALVKFQSFPEYREKCYGALQISQPESIVNGIDRLAVRYNLELTKRTFIETDFSYLE